MPITKETDTKPTPPAPTTKSKDAVARGSKSELPTKIDKTDFPGPGGGGGGDAGTGS